MSWIGCMALEGMLWARTGVVGLEKLLWGWRGGVEQGTVGCNGAGWVLRGWMGWVVMWD